VGSSVLCEPRKLLSRADASAVLPPMVTVPSGFVLIESTDGHFRMVPDDNSQSERKLSEEPVEAGLGLAVSSSSVFVSPRLPSKSDLASRTHLDASMAMLGSSASRGKKNGSKGGKMTRLVAEGRDKSKFYNVVAGRPFPKFVSLEQEIRAVDTFTISSFLTTSTATNTYNAQAFTLSNFSMNSAYTALFDQYRVDQLEVWLEPTNSQGATVFGELITAVDLDDANAPTTASLGDKQGALVGLGAGGRYHCWKPHVAVATYGGAFTSYGNVPAMWIDSASTSVQHYGFKIVALPTPAQTITYALTCRGVFSFRAPGL